MTLAAENVAAGERVHCLGNPGAKPTLWTYSSGLIASVATRKTNQFKSGQRVEAKAFRAMMPISPGSSGSPVVNDSGQVVGVAYAGRGEEQAAQCISVNEVRAFLDESGQSGPSSADLRDKGTRLMRQADYQGAITCFDDAVKLDPKDYLAFNERGAAYTWLDKDAAAIQDFTRALAVNDRFPVAYRNRGAAYLRLGKLPQALDDLNRAIALNADYARAYKDRGAVYGKMGKPQQAEADFKKARERVAESLRPRRGFDLTAGPAAAHSRDAKGEATIPGTHLSAGVFHGACCFPGSS